jgi:predicted site-specific integrase-resolvase
MRAEEVFRLLQISSRSLYRYRREGIINVSGAKKSYKLDSQQISVYRTKNRADKVVNKDTINFS